MNIIKTLVIALTAVTTLGISTAIAEDKREVIVAAITGDICPTDTTTETYTCKYADEKFAFIHGQQANSTRFDQIKFDPDYTQPQYYKDVNFNRIEWRAPGWYFAEGNAFVLIKRNTAVAGPSYLTTPGRDILEERIDHGTWIELKISVDGTISNVIFFKDDTFWPAGAANPVPMNLTVNTKLEDGEICMEHNAVGITRNCVAAEVFELTHIEKVLALYPGAVCPSDTDTYRYTCKYAHGEYSGVHGKQLDAAGTYKPGPIFTFPISSEYDLILSGGSAKFIELSTGEDILLGKGKFSENPQYVDISTGFGDNIVIYSPNRIKLLDNNANFGYFFNQPPQWKFSPYTNKFQPIPQIESVIPDASMIPSNPPGSMTPRALNYVGIITGVTACPSNTDTNKYFCYSASNTLAGKLIQNITMLRQGGEGSCDYFTYPLANPSFVDQQFIVRTCGSSLRDRVFICEKSATATTCITNQNLTDINATQTQIDAGVSVKFLTYEFIDNILLLKFVNGDIIVVHIPQS